MRHLRVTTLCLIIVGFLCAPFFVFAQTTTTAVQPTQGTSELQRQIDQLMQGRLDMLPKIEDTRTSAIRDNLDIKTTPQKPGPLETVRVSIESYLSDLNKATIGWALNGKLIERGIGRKVFSFQNGPSGKTTRLTISITTNTGDSLIKEISWNPFGLTVLWEADTYTPPFYRGKALLTAQAKVRAVALPDNMGGQNALDAGNLVYVWEKDGTKISEASGYGKNSFFFSGPKPYERMNVKVSASSVNDTINSDTRINLPLSQPFILFYEKHPLLGVWYNRPFDTNITLSRKEFSMSAEPYFFSSETSETPALKYDWAINGNATQNYGRTITLRNDTGGKGDSAISLAMRSIRQTFQSASQELLVHFTEDTASRPTF